MVLIGEGIAADTNASIISTPTRSLAPPWRQPSEHCLRWDATQLPPSAEGPLYTRLPMISSGSSFGTTSKFNLSSFSNLLGRCLAQGSLLSAASIHVSLLKTGLHHHTFLGNRLLELYSGLGDVASAVGVFHEIHYKNTFSWNILLMAMLRGGQVEAAYRLFDEMPERDVVSWNSLISGYATYGFVSRALGVFSHMQELGVKASAFTLSIAASCVSSAQQAKQVHCSVVRFGLDYLSATLGNSLIDMYGRVGVASYARNVFNRMDEHDVISWNTIISAYGRTGFNIQALECFCSMRISGFSTDEFTASTTLNICADLQDLAKGEQLLAHCFKMGFLSNSIVSSAVIDMYSICSRLDNAVRIFQGILRWDPALCNSMIACYIRGGLHDEALRLFVVALRKDIQPTEFTLATILNSISCFASIELGTQIHCLVCKTGFEADMVAANALADMYAKLGLIEAAVTIFSTMATKDLVAWNTMILGLAKNGQGEEALRVFGEMQRKGTKPDKVTFVALLLGCSYKGMLHEGKSIFSLMEKEYGVMRDLHHYACAVDMMGRAGRLKEAMVTIENSPHNSSVSLWILLLEACSIYGDLAFAEMIANKLLELEVHSSLPYLLLTRLYGARGQFERMARIQRLMQDRGVKRFRGYSWICIGKCICVFESGQVFHLEGEAMYSMLWFLEWLMETEQPVTGDSVLLDVGYE